MTTPGDASLDMDQVSIILGKNFIISFKEKEVDVFNPLRERLRTSKGKIRKQGADYLAYSMMDSIVDHYFVIMEKLGDRFEDLEDAVVSQSGARNSSHYLQFEKRYAVLAKIGLAAA